MFCPSTSFTSFCLIHFFTFAFDAQVNYSRFLSRFDIFLAYYDAFFVSNRIDSISLVNTDCEKRGNDLTHVYSINDPNHDCCPTASCPAAHIRAGQKKILVLRSGSLDRRDLTAQDGTGTEQKNSSCDHLCLARDEREIQYRFRLVLIRANHRRAIEVVAKSQEHIFSLSKEWSFSELEERKLFTCVSLVFISQHINQSNIDRLLTLQLTHNYDELRAIYICFSF